jgi:uncharacterized RDD family membrane protein YckC
MARGEPPSPERRPLPARLLGLGARGAERVASATGIDDAVDVATEEAIVRALESPAVERALIRVLESDEAQRVLERALSSPAVERTAVRVLDSQLVDHVWDRILASDEAQKLVERIAEAPEVRAALTSQGVGLIEDVGRGVREVSDHVDRALDEVVERARGRSAAEPTEATHVGLFTRLVAAAVDGAALNLTFLAISAIFGITIGGVLGDDRSPSGATLAAGATAWLTASVLYLGMLWSLAGQTLGMRFLSIRLDADGQRRIGARRAIRRLIGTVLSVLSLGIGFAIALFDPRHRTLADRMAGTIVIEADRDTAAPWSRSEPRH